MNKILFHLNCLEHGGAERVVSNLANQFGVFSIPTLVVMRKGKIVRQESGARPKDQILAMLEG